MIGHNPPFLSIRPGSQVLGAEVGAWEAGGRTTRTSHRRLRRPAWADGVLGVLRLEA
jgi:hypothetical protein